MRHLHLPRSLKSAKDAVKSFSRPSSPVQPEPVASPEVTPISAWASTQDKTSPVAPGTEASSATSAFGDPPSIPSVVVSPPPSIPPVVAKKSTDTKDLAIDTIALALGLVKELADIGGTAPFVAPVATVLSKIIEAYQKTQDGKEKRDALLGFITDIARDLCNAISQMKENNLVALLGRLKPDIDAYITILEDTSKFVAEYDGHGGIYHWAASNQQGNKLSTLQQALKSFRERFSTNCLLDQSIQQGISQRTLDHVELMNLETFLEKKLLNPPDMKLKQAVTAKLRKAGTGQWLLNNDQFVKWQNYAGSLWIQGHSGTGKSVLSSAVISTLTEHRRLLGPRGKSCAIAFFYFDINFKEGQPVEAAVRRLVLQLSDQAPDPYGALDKWFKSSGGQIVPDYNALVEILEQLLRGLGHTYIVLDALDECEEGQHKLLIDLISKLRQWTETPLHLLITSQPRDSFIRAFEKLEKVPCIYLKAEVTQEDIRSFVDSRIRAMVVEKSWDTSTPNIVDQLVLKSNGMFRLAACLLDELETCAWETQLDQKLKNLPNTLVGIYDRFLSTIPSDYFVHATAVLRWLLFSARPIGFYTQKFAPVDSQTELADAIAFDFGDAAHSYEPTRCKGNSIAMVGWLKGLVAVNERDGKPFLALAHASVHQYLLDKEIKKPFNCDFSAPSSHTFIARSCLGYLLHFADQRLDSATLPNYPLALYAANSFYNHLVQCHDATVLFPEALRLLQNGSKQYSALNYLSNTDFRGHWREKWDIGARTPLYLCSEQGYPALVQLILDNGADVNAPGGGYGSPLLAATIRGNTGVVQLLLEHRADINFESGERGSAFCVASEDGNIEIAQLLLEHGAHINVQDEDFAKALLDASSQGAIELVRLLLGHDPDITAHPGIYGSALHGAARKGKLAVAQLLLECGADVNAQGGKYGSPLQAAAACEEKDSLDVVRLLLKHGADINARGGKLGSALQAAASKGATDIVRLLLSYGADVNGPDLRGENSNAQGGRFGTALQAAAFCEPNSKALDLVRLLLESGADVNAQGGEYGTALTAASVRGFTDVVQLLLDNGADVNAPGGELGSALQAACSEGATDVVRLLLSYDADVNGPDLRGENSNAQGGRFGTALQAAAFCEPNSKALDLVRLLLESGADVNAQGGKYGTALTAASVRGFTDVVQLLLDNGADVNAQGGEYGTALTVASVRGFTDVVQLLLDNGADVNAQGGEYGTALTAASVRGFTDVVQLLLDHNADVNGPGGKFGNTLQAACSKGATDVVRLLLSYGADFNVPDLHGENSNTQGGRFGTALQAAAFCRPNSKALDIVRLLLESGADVNAEGGKYGTALTAASLRGSTDVVQLLLDNGADVNAPGGELGSALQAACSEGATDVVRLLLSYGADVNGPDLRGENSNAQGGPFGTALQAAAFCRHQSKALELVRLLLDSGADVNAQGGMWETALAAASFRGFTFVVQLLLDNGADVNGCSGKALRNATLHGHTATVKLLLARGAHVNARGKMGNDSLQLASREGNLEIVQLLLDNGADVNAQGGVYGSALEAARRKGHAEIVQILVQNGAVPRAEVEGEPQVSIEKTN
ncbi:ankyrin repeat-containing domain protein [Mycena vulgaris]|nr:ankyrin repeat-containing domain protein [Mycena vulgaris]